MAIGKVGAPCVTWPGMNSYVWRCMHPCCGQVLTGGDRKLCCPPWDPACALLLLLLRVDRMLETGPHWCTLYPVFTLPPPAIIIFGPLFWPTLRFLATVVSWLTVSFGRHMFNDANTGPGQSSVVSFSTKQAPKRAWRNLFPFLCNPKRVEGILWPLFVG